MLNTIYKACVLLSAAAISHAFAQSQPPAILEPVGKTLCPDIQANCQRFDAIIFVHGIYGSEETFRNSKTGFDWPGALPREIKGRSIDVYRIHYKSALLNWSKENNPAFDSVAKAIYDAMKPLRQRNYRSIGFIAHSLGGNFISTYIHEVKTGLGHPHRSQNAYYITLATPVMGADIASLAFPLKTFLGMNDDLLNSLKKENLYLRMLKQFRELEGPKGDKFGCRPVHLHSAYEKDRIGPITVVTQDSAAQAIAKMVASPIVGFQLDHFSIVKPESDSDPVFVWAHNILESEFDRLNKWDNSQNNVAEEYKLCNRAPFIPES